MMRSGEGVSIKQQPLPNSPFPFFCKRLVSVLAVLSVHGLYKVVESRRLLAEREPKLNC